MKNNSSINDYIIDEYHKNYWFRLPGETKLWKNQLKIGYWKPVIQLIVLELMMMVT